MLLAHETGGVQTNVQRMICSGLINFFSQQVLKILKLEVWFMLCRSFFFMVSSQVKSVKCDSVKLIHSKLERFYDKLSASTRGMEAIFIPLPNSQWCSQPNGLKMVFITQTYSSLELQQSSIEEQQCVQKLSMFVPQMKHLIWSPHSPHLQWVCCGSTDLWQPSCFWQHDNVRWMNIEQRYGRKLGMTLCHTLFLSIFRQFHNPHFSWHTVGHSGCGTVTAQHVQLST